MVDVTRAGRTSDDTVIKDTGFLTGQAADMQEGVKEMKTQLEAAKKKLSSDPSNPGVLAAYQSALSEYNLFRNAQSNMVKAYKDIGSSIVQNFKN